jgi:hypothetical protein
VTAGTVGVKELVQLGRVFIAKLGTHVGNEGDELDAGDIFSARFKQGVAGVFLMGHKPADANNFGLWVS